MFDVEVWDNDDGYIIGKVKDFVDYYLLFIWISLFVNFVFVLVRCYKFIGLGYLYLNVEVKVFCDVNYFILDCFMYCVLWDDNSGYYICDYI